MRAIRICVLGLVLLGVGLGIFFGAQLKYLPKYHTIVMANYYTSWVRRRVAG